jgi:X-Pro dipeptidyl-peptidase (S15 family).
MRLRRFIIIALIITAAIAAVWFGVGLIVMKNAIESYQIQKSGSSYEDFARTKCFNEAQFNKLKKVNLTIPSKKDGCLLSATLIYNPIPSANTIIYSHMITGSRWDVLKGGRIDSLLARGFNVLTFDQRAHGKSEGSVPTYGFLEKHDLDQWIDTIAAIFPNGIIGVEGVSTGAATAILHAGEINPKKDVSKKVAFYVFECSYSDLAKQLAYKVNQHYYLPNMALNTSLKILDHPFNGFNIYDVSPIKAVRHIDVPVLFVHSKADSYVPTLMGKELYNAAHPPKMMLLVPKVNHADAIYSPKLYWNTYDYFLKKIVKIKR